MSRMALLTLALIPSLSSAQVDFSRDVLPILAENCFHCHGPDAKSRQAGLRLDTPDGAFRKKRDRTIILPGKADESELIRRIFADDADMMPPADSKRKLTQKQKLTLKTWVDAGAHWSRHWAYEPLPKNIPIPGSDANPIDSFIKARLKKEGLALSPPASPERWLRRVSLDLTGLPPTPDELTAFLKDTSPTARNAVVDRLLASPRYGERMATEWLDLARYADTQGYQHDRAWAVWPYRDWVIRAFNRNQPFDQFLTEQLAGDLLPKAEKHQKLATAFNRLHMQNEEGGIVEEEFRVAYVVDRVNTFGTAFLGQTLECSRCHDHKYDPFTQKDFYSLFAFFQNIDESGQTSYFTNSQNTPTLLLSSAEQDAVINTMKNNIHNISQSQKTLRADRQPKYLEWLFSQGSLMNVILNFNRDCVAEYHFSKQHNTSIVNLIDNKTSAQAHDNPRVENDAVHLNGENGFEFPGIGHFQRSDPFSIRIVLKTDHFRPRAVVLHHSKAPIDAGSRGYELLLENGHVTFGLHHMWPGNSLKVKTQEKIPLHQWATIIVNYDGSSQAQGLEIFIDGQPTTKLIIRENLTKDITYSHQEPNLTLGYRFRDNGFKNGSVKSLSIHSRPLTKFEISLYSAQSHNNHNTIADHLYDLFLVAEDQQYRKCCEDLRQARRKLAAYVEPIPEIMIMDELPTPRPAHLLKRGAYDALGETVRADVPKALPPLASELPRNRLGLARWLTQPDHPLTARVTVNRLWQQMFGRGLVETSDNFGTTGTPPTHPDLLDWLARDFINHGWNVKHCLKQMALSETYQQSSRASPEARAKDPQNHLLARYPARKLTAEMLRDQALFVSGLLVEKLGGPSVFPYQPAGLWDEAMGKPKYPQSKGDDLYRRSLYTHWKRTAPPPTMITFDAADRNNCSARRQMTSTPLQSLVLLNDPQMVEAARMLAERMMKASALEERIMLGFRAVTSRVPTTEETKILVKLMADQKAQFTADEKAAEQLLTVGEKPRNKKLDPVELAALTQVALAILNHDEAVYRR